MHGAVDQGDPRQDLGVRPCSPPDQKNTRLSRDTDLLPGGFWAVTSSNHLLEGLSAFLMRFLRVVRHQHRSPAVEDVKLLEFSVFARKKCFAPMLFGKNERSVLVFPWPSLKTLPQPITIRPFFSPSIP